MGTYDPVGHQTILGKGLVYSGQAKAGFRRPKATYILHHAGPVQATRFVDTSKTDRESCRYYITAVDAIGQEGYASYGAWLNDPNRS